jgi:hypothetical protein
MTRKYSDSGKLKFPSILNNIGYQKKATEFAQKCGGKEKKGQHTTSTWLMNARRSPDVFFLTPRDKSNIKNTFCKTRNSQTILGKSKKKKETTLTDYRIASDSYSKSAWDILLLVL